VLAKWGTVTDELQKQACHATKIVLHSSDGTVLHTQNMILESDGYPFLSNHRGFAQVVFYNFAIKLGIKVEFGVRITEYFDDKNSAGVIANGVRYEADVVIGCDGIHSKARDAVTGVPTKPISSGFAIYRAWYPLDHLHGDPLLEDLANGGDSMNAWIGPDVHCFATVCSAADRLVVLITHKDDYAVEESWSSLGRIEDVMKVVNGWDPILQRLVKTIPADKLIDWKLLWRDPVRRWVSDNGRIALCGDSAHPFLPSSGNGASQAIEDSATIAATLRLAGRGNVVLALRAYEALRYKLTI
jgi:2-polyprenyl-6-methoxyphenol hydroxylase-like FAD-dependent oxidoreductase